MQDKGTWGGRENREGILWEGRQNEVISGERGKLEGTGLLLSPEQEVQGACVTGSPTSSFGRQQGTCYGGGQGCDGA